MPGCIAFQTPRDYHHDRRGERSAGNRLRDLDNGTSYKKVRNNQSMFEDAFVLLLSVEKRKNA